MTATTRGITPKGARPATPFGRWNGDRPEFPLWVMPRYRYNGGLNNSFVREGTLNGCRAIFVRGFASDYGDDGDWMFEPGQPCAEFAR